MRKLCIASVLLVAGISSSSLLDRAPGPNAISGTFLVQFTLPVGTLLALAQTHPDGTTTFVDQTDFGLGGLTAGPNSESYGVWEVSGPRQTTGVFLFFAYDPAGIPTTVDRVTVVTDWDAGFNNGTGMTTQRSYNPALGEDPLDPTQGTPVPGAPFTARRLTTN